MAYCAACFDVKKAGQDLASGHQGIGGCVYYDANKNLFSDFNFFGTVEAQGTDSFKFLPKDKNDWSYEDTSGFMGFDSKITWDGATMTDLGSSP